MLRTIMVETGETPEALAAMETALRLAQAFGARLIAMSHLDERAMRSDHVRRMLEQHLRAEQDAYAKRCQAVGVECVREMDLGDRRSALAQLSLKADLLVVGEPTRHDGEGAGFRAGTVAIAREVVREVLFVGNTAPTFQTIVVGYAGRENSCNALRLMAHIGDKFRSTIHIVTSDLDVARGESLLSAASDYLDPFAVKGVKHRMQDEPASAILTVARQVAADTIAIGAYRANKLHLLSFGSTSTHVLAESPVPVFVCR